MTDSQSQLTTRDNRIHFRNRGTCHVAVGFHMGGSNDEIIQVSNLPYGGGDKIALRLTPEIAFQLGRAHLSTLH